MTRIQIYPLGGHPDAHAQRTGKKGTSRFLRPIPVLARRHPRSIAVSSALLFHPDRARGLDDLGARPSGASGLFQPRKQGESEAFLVRPTRRPLRESRAGTSTPRFTWA